MSYNVHPFPTYTSSWDATKQRTVWEQTGFSPGMTVRQLYMAHILQGLASNPATMLNIEDHVSYAIQLATLVHNKMPD